MIRPNGKPAFSFAYSKYGRREIMAHVKMQNDYYCVVLKGCRKTRWLADERVKKQFIDQLLKVREKLSFRVYAFCILDEEVQLLLSIPWGRKIDRTAAKISRELHTSYLSYNPLGEEEAAVTVKRLSPCSYAVLLEHCCRIHLLAKGHAGKMQDYWWSSYVEYLHKNVTGLVETGALLHVLDPEPHRAMQKFVQYHKKYLLTTKNESENEI